MMSPGFAQLVTRRMSHSFVCALVLVLLGCASSPRTEELELAEVDEAAPDIASDLAVEPPEDVGLTEDLAELDAADEGADTSASDDLASPDDAEEECDCPEAMWCGEMGCELDLCLQGQTTCHDLAATMTCAEDGSGFSIAPCADGEVCYLGLCKAPT